MEKPDSKGRRDPLVQPGLQARKDLKECREHRVHKDQPGRQERQGRLVQLERPD